MVIFEVFSDLSKQGVRKVAIFSKIGAVFEVDEVDVGWIGGGDGFLREGDQRVVVIGEIIILDKGCGGAKKAIDFELIGDKTGKAEGGVFGWTFLKISWFVSFVDNDEAEVF